MNDPGATPDRFDFYERAAQDPDRQARFLRALCADPRAPGALGEDFSAAGAISRAWIDLHPDNRAVCVDHDPAPLERLRRRASDPARLLIRRADVRAVRDKVNVLAVLNFSICEFHHRDDLVDYLRHARRRLGPADPLVIDIYAGTDALVTGESDVELRDGVRYVWEQRAANPLTGRVVNAMHFFPQDDPPLQDAFVYDWRLWSVPELRDALLEAGFHALDIYTELAAAEDQDGSLYPLPVTDPADLDDNFVAYIAARSVDRDAASGLDEREARA